MNMSFISELHSFQSRRYNATGDQWRDTSYLLLLGKTHFKFVFRGNQWQHSISIYCLCTNFCWFSLFHTKLTFDQQYRLILFLVSRISPILTLKTTTENLLSRHPFMAIHPWKNPSGAPDKPGSAHIHRNLPSLSMAVRSILLNTHDHTFKHVAKSSGCQFTWRVG